MSFVVTTTWGHLNRKGPSAWDAARTDYGEQAFDSLPRDQQIRTVQQYVSR